MDPSSLCFDLGYSFHFQRRQMATGSVCSHRLMVTKRKNDKERQPPSRAKWKKTDVGDQQLSLTANTDTPIPVVEEPSVTVCEAPVPEIGPEEAETQHSACYSSPAEGHDISESVPLSVTPEACSEREELRVIEE